eukprot:scaffold245036_cov48-Prasinocladus_malaysianus.AAC.1
MNSPIGPGDAALYSGTSSYSPRCFPLTNSELGRTPPEQDLCSAGSALDARSFCPYGTSGGLRPRARVSRLVLVEHCAVEAPYRVEVVRAI